jgi:hypothetical protein
VLGFSEDARVDEGGDNRMSELLEELGLSEDELKARLDRADELERKDREATIDKRCETWEGEHKAPAMVAEARSIMLADDGSQALLLSENGRETALSATDIVERLMDKAPSMALSEEDKSGGQETASAEERPEDDASKENVNLSRSEKAEASRLYLEEGLSQAEAIEKVVSKRGDRS